MFNRESKGLHQHLHATVKRLHIKSEQKLSVLLDGGVLKVSERVKESLRGLVQQNDVDSPVVAVILIPKGRSRLRG